MKTKQIMQSPNGSQSIMSILLLILAMVLGGCGAGESAEENPDSTGGTATTAPSLNQAAYVSGSATYQFGHNSIPNIAISGAPDDTDWNRWAMLHDGANYRLYFFKYGSNDTIYQFAFNTGASRYEYGYNSIATLKITGIPGDADSNSFAMLHDGSRYRLYLRSLSRSAVYQFVFNSASSNYEYGFGGAIPRIDVTGAPSDADFDRWAILHDGGTYRLYAARGTLDNVLYQFAYNPSTRKYEYGYNSIDVLTVDLIPQNSDTSEFAMLHDGKDYRFYYLTL